MCQKWNFLSEVCVCAQQMHPADRLIEVALVADLGCKGAFSSFVRRFTRQRLMLGVSPSTPNHAPYSLPPENRGFPLSLFTPPQPPLERIPPVPPRGGVVASQRLRVDNPVICARMGLRKSGKGAIYDATGYSC